MRNLSSWMFASGVVLVVLGVVTMRVAPQADFSALPSYDLSLSMEFSTLSLGLLLAGIAAIVTSVGGGPRRQR